MSFQIALGPRERKSPFYDSTVTDGVSHMTIYNDMFMPVSYGDIDAEYRRLMQGVAMWDVAAERQVEIQGKDAERLVRYLTPRDLKDCAIGKGKYVPLCDHEGRLLNDPVLLRLEDDRFWLSIADSNVLLWVRAIAAEGGFDVSVQEPDVSPLAIQGPKAVDVVVDLFGGWVRDLKYFWFRQTELDGIPLVVARSGWSKQGGYELYLRDGTRGGALWDKVKKAGAAYGIGPGAPNYIERVESGLLSYGADTMPDSTPYEVGLEKMIDLDRPDDFIGKQALARVAKEGPARRLVGITFDGDPVSTNEHPWSVRVDGHIAGTVRAVCHSPRRAENIGIALLETKYADIGTVIEFKGEKASYKGEVVPQPLVPPGTPIPE
ncbi:MAG: dimethylsulfoniopropionate demethylase [Rhodospirillales bacterium]|nr:dimethylsulfoniopropionate demethylase [Rhodospirillales bacterium]